MTAFPSILYRIKILEYKVVICHLYLTCNKLRIKPVQHKCLYFVAFVLKIEYPNHGYSRLQLSLDFILKSPVVLKLTSILITLFYLFPNLLQLYKKSFSTSITALSCFILCTIIHYIKFSVQYRIAPFIFIIIKDITVNHYYCFIFSLKFLYSRLNLLYLSQLLFYRISN